MRAIKILHSTLILFLFGCQGVVGQAGYQPPILPLKVAVDTNGEISFDLQAEVEYPTPLGTFSVGVIVDPIEYFNRDGTLTIRIDCEDNFYDLHRKNFSIELESGYYEKINLTKRGNDILLNLRRIGISPVDCPLPTSKQPTVSSEADKNFTATQVAITVKSLVKVEEVLLLTNRDLFWDICEEYLGSCDSIDNIRYTISNNWNGDVTIGYKRCLIEGVEIHGSAQMIYNHWKDLSPGDRHTFNCLLEGMSPENNKVSVSVDYGDKYGCWYLYPYTSKIEECDN